MDGIRVIHGQKICHGISDAQREQKVHSYPAQVDLAVCGEQEQDIPVKGIRADLKRDDGLVDPGMRQLNGALGAGTADQNGVSMGGILGVDIPNVLKVLIGHHRGVAVQLDTRQCIQRGLIKMKTCNQ